VPAGHTGPVNSVAWSRDASMLVSASADRTLRVWSPLKSTAEALVVIDRRGAGGGGGAGGVPGALAGGVNAKVPAVGSGAGKRGDEMLPDEVKAAQFFYMDRFLCAVVGGRMILYELKLASEGADDLERLRKRHRFREVLCVQSRAERIQAMACVNLFLSHLLLCACSNRSIELWDAATNQLVHAIPDAHERVPHALVINEVSQTSVSLVTHTPAHTHTNTHTRTKGEHSKCACVHPSCGAPEHPPAGVRFRAPGWV